MEKVFNTRLRDFPLPAKALAATYILALGVAYLYALTNIALVVGLSPKDIAKHYYGEHPEVPAASASGEEEEINLDDVVETPAAIPGWSFKNLVTAGHFHMFGMSSFFFGLTLFGLFTGASIRFKTFMVATPYLLVILDNLSFMATRFLGPHFSYLTAVVGGLMGLNFMILWFFVAKELIHKSGAQA